MEVPHQPGAPLLQGEPQMEACWPMPLVYGFLKCVHFWGVSLCCKPGYSDLLRNLCHKLPNTAGTRGQPVLVGFGECRGWAERAPFRCLPEPAPQNGARVSARSEGAKPEQLKTSNDTGCVRGYGRDAITIGSEGPADQGRLSSPTRSGMSTSLSWMRVVRPPSRSMRSSLASPRIRS